jgi:hypothetical protein
MKSITVILWLVSALILLGTPAHAADKPRYYLMLTIVMPANVPDVRQQFPADSLDECWAEAKSAVQHGVPKKLAADGALAVMAGCLSLEVAESDL